MTSISIGRPLGRRRFAALCLPLTAAACGSSPDPRLYSIGLKQGAVLPGGPKIALLRDIGLAGYLDRKQIVRSQDDNLLALHGNDWWGEPQDVVAPPAAAPAATDSYGTSGHTDGHGFEYVQAEPSGRPESGHTESGHTDSGADPGPWAGSRGGAHEDDDIWGDPSDGSTDGRDGGR